MRCSRGTLSKSLRVSNAFIFHPASGPTSKCSSENSFGNTFLRLQKRSNHFVIKPLPFTLSPSSQELLREHKIYKKTKNNIFTSNLHCYGTSTAVSVNEKSDNTSVGNIAPNDTSEKSE